MACAFTCILIQFLRIRIRYIRAFRDSCLIHTRVFVAFSPTWHFNIHLLFFSWTIFQTKNISARVTASNFTNLTILKNKLYRENDDKLQQICNSCITTAALQQKLNLADFCIFGQFYVRLTLGINNVKIIKIIFFLQ